MPKSSIQEKDSNGRRIRTGVDRYPLDKGFSMDLDYTRNKKIKQPQALPRPPYSKKKTSYVS
jgi:hypothetical protein